MLSRTICVLAGLVVAGSAAVTSQVTWTEFHPDTSPPQPFWPAMAFDEARGVAVLVTGIFGEGGDFMTWEWDGSDWSERNPSTNPPFREGVGMAYDKARQRIVLAGGLNFNTPPQGPFEDTWEWDGTNWELRSTNGPSPLRRHRPAMAYDDTRQRVICVAGTTWEWDGTEWHDITPPAPPHPPNNARLIAAYDGARRSMVVYDDLGFLWEWDSERWEGPVVVPSLCLPSIAWDADRRRTVFFSGCGPEAQTWEWDGADFEQRHPSSQPPNRMSAPMTFDAARGVVLLFGGYLFATADTWQYATAQPATLEGFGIGCVGTAGAPVLAPEPFQLPWVGDRVVVSVQPIPPGAPSFLLLGLSNTMAGLLTLPFDLTVIGMPGCTLYTSLEKVIPMASVPAEGVGPASATLELVMPTAPVLAGTPFYLQASVFDPGANPRSLVASNAYAGRLGLR